MQFIGWMYDIAREQSPREDRLHELIWRSADAGYGALGLYLEHRYAFPSAPWAAAPGSLTPAVVGRLQETAREAGVRLIPFLNTLGHMEGFIRSEGGQWLAESPGRRVLQMCPSREECADFAVNLVDDAIEAFEDEWVHLGGDETHQLGTCPLCAERVRAIGKEGIYGEFFGRLCRHLLERGRRPCLWGDMLIKYPAALAHIPRETVIFDWHYDAASPVTAAMFREKGYEVVCCPAIRSYDSGWCFLDETRRVIDQHAAEARRAERGGVCVCAWEFFGFSSFSSLQPLILAAGRRLSMDEDWKTVLEIEGGAEYAKAAEILGSRIPSLSPFLAPGTWRSLRIRLGLGCDPFALWRDWRREIVEQGTVDLLQVLEEASGQLEEESPLRFPIVLHRASLEWVGLAEEAARAYARGDLESCKDALMAGQGALGRLHPFLERISEEGGSSADLYRLDCILESIGRACGRIQAIEPGNDWRPAFETITQEGCLPGDQAAWPTDGPVIRESQ